MKILDIALEYLNQIDFTKINLERLARPSLAGLTPDEQAQKDKIKQTGEKYLTDTRLTGSNEYYYSVVFETALIIKKEQSGSVKDNYFINCCFIIGINTKGPLNWLLNLPKELGYPKRLLKKFNGYCNGFPDPPYYIKNKELRMDIFVVAYHYLIDNK